MRIDDRPYLPQKPHLLIGQLPHHPQVVDKLLQRCDTVLLERCREDVELPEVADLNAVPTLTQYIQSVAVDEHPAHRSCRSLHVSRLPAEDLEEPVGILSDGRPALGIRLATREDDDMHILLTLRRLEQNVHQLPVPLYRLRPLFRVEAQLPSDEDRQDLVVGTLGIVVESTQ